MRKLRHTVAVENYERNRRDWSTRYGPCAVMENPTDDHVKVLLMKWVAVNNAVLDVQSELKRRGQTEHGIDYLRRRLCVDPLLFGKVTAPLEVEKSRLLMEVWASIARIALDL